MKGFSGFPAGKQTLTPLPSLFFSELLPAIDHLAELKVTLYAFWLLAQKKGGHRYVSRQELEADNLLLDGLESEGLTPAETLRDALDRAVARQSLLRVFVGEGASRRDWYFANSEKGRQAVDDLLAGRWTLDGQDEPVAVQTQRPNIFVLYEQNIGPLTPLLAEELMEAEDTYPSSWIKDAFREAVELNKRSWRYVERILERWAQEGRSDEESQGADDRGRRRFIEGEYADYIEH
jgi:DnaD/phage-associated family protein